MKALRKNLKRLDKSGKKLFWSLTCLLFAAVSLYVYLVNTAALNGVRWGDGEQEISGLSGRVSELESRYLSLQQAVSLKTAYARGFEDVRTVQFISTRKVGAVATAQ